MYGQRREFLGAYVLVFTFEGEVINELVTPPKPGQTGSELLIMQTLNGEGSWCITHRCSYSEAEPYRRYADSAHTEADGLWERETAR